MPLTSSGVAGTDAFVVVSEVLHNTRSVLLWIVGRDALADVKLRLDAARSLALVEVNGTLWPCRVPKNLVWTQSVQLTRAADHVALRLAIEPFGPCESVLLQGKAREAPEVVMPRLQQANNDLQCRACRAATFVTGAPFARVLRLPSAFWQELAELWGCHTETFVAAPNKELVIERGSLYIGDTHLLLHPSHVSSIALVCAPDTQRRLRCGKCGAVVGRKTRDGSLAIYFHSVTDGRGLWGGCTLQKRLARQIFELSRGSGDMRFVCNGAGGRALSLVLLNWDSTMAVEPGAQPEPVLKVRFEAAASGAAGEDDLGRVVPLDWDEPETMHVWQALEENRQRHLPPSLAGLNTSFLWL